MSFCGRTNPLKGLPISYDEALMRIEQVVSISSVADDESSATSKAPFSSVLRPATRTDSTCVSLTQAAGWRCSCDLFAPHSTPRTDNSAMDGFAVNARSITDATEDSPIKLLVIDSIAAGDNPSVWSEVHHQAHESQSVCVEIMTGASFPEECMPQLDSVIKIEDVTVSQDQSVDRPNRYIEVIQPVRQFQHRRPAGSDFVRGEMVMKSGTLIEPRHLAVLASLGYTHVDVVPASFQDASCSDFARGLSGFRVGILSTGSEIISKASEVEDDETTNTSVKHVIPDSNGPYMVSTLRQACPFATIEYLGVVTDEEEILTERLRNAIFQGNFDIIITSGGVSKGRHDLVRHIVETKLGGRVIFHGVKIRPGAPILFASFDGDNGTDIVRSQNVVFGVPGNPVAAAVALRFFVMPYMRRVGANALELTRNDNVPIQEGKDPKTSHSNGENHASMGFGSRHKSKDTTIFRLARRSNTNLRHVKILEDQASYKLRGFLEANCWVTLSGLYDDTSDVDQLQVTPL